MDICVRIPQWVEDMAAPGTVYPTDEARMELAVALAQENVRRGGGPFGAAVFHAGSGRLVAAGVNMVLQANLSAFHAEVTALCAAQTLSLIHISEPTRLLLQANLSDFHAEVTALCAAQTRLGS